MSEVRFWEKDFVLLVYKQAVYWSLRSSTFGDGKNTGFCAEGSGPAAQVQERPPSPLLR